MLRIIAMMACVSCASIAHAQSSTVNEAMNRGLDVRSVPAPGRQKMTPEQWRRRQLAAVDRSQKIMIEAQKLPGLLGQYLQMKANYDGSDELAFRMVFGQYLSWYQTFVGDYDAARETFSIAQNAQADDASSPIAAGLSARAAGEVILRLAQGRKAVFFNEAHSAPVTRTLTVELLAKLREQGFSYFAAETLYTTDKDLARRGYPTTASGFYVAEPVYGEMIRAALRLGYHVIAYDAGDNGSGEAREKAGAEALYAQTFKRDPQARLVLNAGFGHIQKSGTHLGGASMAEWFEKLSGVEPLAIEQTMLIEHARAGQDHPIYRAAIAAPHPDRPFVYVDSGGRPWTLEPGKYDVSVFFPPQTQAEGRPTWPSLDAARKSYAIDTGLCRGTSPCLVEARYANEGDDAIPADRVVLGSMQSGSAGKGVARAGTGSSFGGPDATAPRLQSLLYLYPGRYRLRASDRDNRELGSRTIDVATATPHTRANPGNVAQRRSAAPSPNPPPEQARRTGLSHASSDGGRRRGSSRPFLADSLRATFAPSRPSAPSMGERAGVREAAQRFCATPWKAGCAAPCWLLDRIRRHS